MSSSLLGLCLALVIAQIAVPARALELRWRAPSDECPDESAVRANVEATLGPRAHSEGELVVEAQVTREVDRWLLEVRLAGAHESDWRMLSAQSCEALVEATAVIVAALLPAPAPTVSEAPAPPKPPVVVPVALEGSLGAGAELGALPSPSPMFSAGTSLTVASIRVGLHGQFVLPRDASLAELPEAKPRIGLYTGAVSLCYDLALRSTRLSPCAWFEAGQLFARERGLPSGQTGRALWLSGGGSLALGLPLGKRWLLSPEVLVFAPLRNSSFYVGPMGDAVLAHRAKTLSLRGLLTMGMRFWSLEKLW